MDTETNLLGNPRNYFEELVKLSALKNSRFKIIGEYKNFVIKAKSDNVILAICLPVIIAIPVGWVIVDYLNPITWLYITIIFGGILAFFKYYPSTNDIEVDTYLKKLTIKSNNLIGKFIIPITTIEFNEFKEFTTKEKAVKSYFFVRVYIHYNDKKKPLIDLPNGPTFFISHKTFTDSLAGILKEEHRVHS